MKRFLVTGTLIGALILAAVAAVWITALTSAPAEAAACRCPLIYAPVICSNGKTYPNQCVADCHHAKDCQPAGEL